MDPTLCLTTATTTTTTNCRILLIIMLNIVTLIPTTFAEPHVPGYLVKTPNCMLPDHDPWSKSIQLYLKEPAKVNPDNQYEMFEIFHIYLIY